MTITQLIQSGAHDAELEDIERALKNRRAVQQMNMRSELVRGQEIWFNDKVRPNYLRGRRCKVEEVNRVRIAVRLVNPSPGERFHGVINCPPDLLTHVKPAYAAD